MNRQLKVLLVDDESSVHEIFELFLSESEFSLMFAMSVADAMAQIAVNRPDIVVTDAMMPGESGFVLISKLRSDPRTEDIPIILWTMLEQPDGSVMDASGKADITISKPLHLSDILSALQEAKDLIKYRKIAKVGLSGSDTHIEVVF